MFIKTITIHPSKITIQYYILFLDIYSNDI